MKVKVWHIVAIIVLAGAAYYAYAEYQRKRIQDQVNDMVNGKKDENPATVSNIEANKKAFATLKEPGYLNDKG